MAEVLKLEEVEGSLAVGAGGSFETRIVRLPMLVLLKGSKAFCTFSGITVHVPCGEDTLLCSREGLCLQEVRCGFQREGCKGDVEGSVPLQSVVTSGLKPTPTTSHRRVPLI